LNAINLDTGECVWKETFGLFIGAAVLDKKFRAYDKTTGKLLWEFGCRSQEMLHLLHTKFADGSTSSLPADSGTQALPGAEEYAAFALP
jgi:hypothetical protein